VKPGSLKNQESSVKEFYIEMLFVFLRDGKGDCETIWRYPEAEFLRQSRTALMR
jgi:hypothetical protein